MAITDVIFWNVYTEGKKENCNCAKTGLSLEKTAEFQGSNRGEAKGARGDEHVIQEGRDLVLLSPIFIPTQSQGDIWQVLFF